MQAMFILTIFITFVVMGSFYISKENGNLDKELKNIKTEDVKPLKTLQDKFSKFKLDDKNFDLQKAIDEVKQARKHYPLDNKLQMIDMKLENKRANES
ncbi:MAG: hypothetical protein JJW00_03280 [Sulfurimonas sp.]|nr:hypothetical protein [Sulfurimonas sp.]